MALQITVDYSTSPNKWRRMRRLVRISGRRPKWRTVIIIAVLSFFTVLWIYGHLPLTGSAPAAGLLHHEKEHLSYNYDEGKTYEIKQVRFLLPIHYYLCYIKILWLNNFFFAETPVTFFISMFKVTLTFNFFVSTMKTRGCFFNLKSSWMFWLALPDSYEYLWCYVSTAIINILILAVGLSLYVIIWRLQTSDFNV